MIGQSKTSPRRLQTRHQAANAAAAAAATANTSGLWQWVSAPSSSACSSGFAPFVRVYCPCTCRTSGSDKAHTHTHTHFALREQHSRRGELWAGAEGARNRLQERTQSTLRILRLQGRYRPGRCLPLARCPPVGGLRLHVQAVLARRCSETWHRAQRQWPSQTKRCVRAMHRLCRQSTTHGCCHCFCLV